MESKLANCIIGIGMVLTAFGAMIAMPSAKAAPDMGWGIPSPLQPWQEGNLGAPELVMNTGGNAFAAWHQSEGTRVNIMANIYSPSMDRWDVPSTVQNGPYDAYIPDIAVDGSGNALAVWNTWNGERWSVFASQYLAGSGWTPDRQIDSIALGGTDVPRVSMNRAGEAVAVWTQQDSGQTVIFSNFFRPGTGWLGAVRIDPVSGDSGVPRVAVDPNGNAIAVWMEFNTQWRIAASRYTAGGSWDSRVFIESSIEYGFNPQVAVDELGNGLAIWAQQSVTYVNIVANRYNATIGWEGETLVESVDQDVLGSPKLAMNRDGEACAVWSQFDGADYSIFANFYDPATDTWDLPIVAEFLSQAAYDADVALDDAGNAFVTFRLWDSVNGWTDVLTSVIAPGPVVTSTNFMEIFDKDATSPKVAVDTVGNAIVIWMQWFEADKRYSLYSLHYVAGSGWVWPPMKVEFDDEGWSSFVRLAVNTAGVAIASWTQDDGPVSDAYATAFSPATGWANSKLLERDNRGDALDTAAGIDDAGNGIVVWRQWNGTNWAVFASHYLFGSGWTLPVEISSSGGDALPPQIAVNQAGTAFVAWRTWDGVTKRLWAVRYTPGTGWGSPVLVDSSVPNDILDPMIAIDDAGNAIIVDSIWDGGQYSIYAYRYIVGTGWGAAVSLENLPNQSFSPRIAMNGGGEAVASWNNLDGADYSVYAIFFSPTLGWHGLAAVENIPGETDQAPVAIDSAGNAYATWQQWDGVNWNVFVARSAGGASWGTPMPVVNYPSTTVTPFIAVNRAGTAVVIYSEADGDRSKTGYIYSAYSRRYDPATGWGPSESLEFREADAWASEVQVDGAGNAVATFLQYDGVRLRPWANRYVEGDGAPRLFLTSPTVTLTNNPSATVAGITDPGATVTVNGVPVAINGLGLFTHPVILTEGLNTFVVVARNLARNTRTVTASVTLDTMPPSLSISTPTGGSIVNTPTVAVTGTTEPTATLVVNGIKVQPVSSGGFAVNVSLLEGLNTIMATATDSATNAQMASVIVTLDTIAPNLLITAPTAVLTSNPNVIVAGQTEPGASVTINGTSVVVDPFGGFSKTVTLPDGEHKFVVVATDVAGNSATDMREITVDATAPNLAITSPLDGTLTAVPFVTVVGYSEPGAYVLVNGIATVPDSLGNFQVWLGLIEGLNTIQAFAVDPAGNTANVSISVTVDTIAPALQVTSPADGLLTNNPSIVVSGHTDPGSNVTIDGVPVGVSPIGDFSQSYNLPEGQRVFDIRASDTAGNVAMTTRTVTVDTTPPALTVNSPVQMLVVATPSVLVSGITEPNAKVTVNGQVVQVQTGGDFSVAVALLVVGQNTITVVAMDQAGNSNTSSRTVVYAAPDIARMQQNITDLQQRIRDLLGNISDLNTTIDNLRNELNGRVDDTNNNITTLLNQLSNLTQTLGHAQRNLDTVRGDVNSLSNVLVMIMAIFIVTLFIGLVGMFLALSRKIGSLRGPQSDLEEVGEAEEETGEKETDTEGKKPEVGETEKEKETEVRKPEAQETEKEKPSN